MHPITGGKDVSSIATIHQYLGQRYLHAAGRPQLLFTDNETNDQRVFGQSNPIPFVKDGINDYVVAGKRDAINSEQTGTKAAAHYLLEIPARKSREVRLRLSDKSEGNDDQFDKAFDDTFTARKVEADELRINHATEHRRRRPQRDAAGLCGHAVV